MTKAELLDAIKDMPDECEMVYWCNGNATFVGGVDCDGVLIYLEVSEWQPDQK